MPNHTSIEDSAGYWISRLARSMEQDFEKRLQKTGITRSAHAVLSTIHHDKKTTPAELANFLGMDGAAISRNLDRMEKQGLIRRQLSKTDRRSVDLDLTKEGIRIVRQGRADSRATNKKFTEGLSDAEVELFRSVVKAMTAKTKGPVADI